MKKRFETNFNSTVRLAEDLQPVVEEKKGILQSIIDKYCCEDGTEEEEKEQSTLGKAIEIAHDTEDVESNSRDVKRLKQEASKKIQDATRDLQQKG